MKKFILFCLAIVCAPAFADCILRQSDAIEIVLGPYVDSTDGVTAETALTISQGDVILKKCTAAGDCAASAQKNDAGSCAHDANGMYECDLDATDTNTVGMLEIWSFEAGAAPVFKTCQVVETAIFDELYADAASGTLAANVLQWNTANVATPATAGYPAVTIKDGTGTGEVDTNAGAVVLTTTTTNLTNAPPNTPADAILLEALVVLGAEQTADSGTTTTLVDAALTQASNDWFRGAGLVFTSGGLAGQQACATAFTAASDTITFTPAVTTAVTTNNYYILANPGFCQSGDSFARLGAPAGASVSADLVIIDDFVDNLEARLGTPTDFGNGTSTLAANLQDLADNGTATFDRATDSLQAIRDRGDAAWTGSGGDSIQGPPFTTIATAPSTTTVTLTAAPNSDTQLPGFAIYIQNNGDADDYCLRKITGVASAVLTYDSACPFTVAAGDTVKLLPGFLDELVHIDTADLFTVDSGETSGTAVAGSVVFEIGELAGAGGAPSAATVAAAVWDLDATGHQTQGTFGQAIGDPAADTDTIFAKVNEIEDETDDIGALGAGLTAADDAVMTRLGVPVTSIAADIQAVEDETDDIGAAGAGLTAADDAVMTRLGTPAGASVSVDVAAVKTDTAAIKLKTDNLPSDPADESLLEAAITVVNTKLASGTSDSGDTNTMVDAALIAAYATDAGLDGAYLVRTSATGKGQRCFIDSYTASTGTVEFGSCAFGSAWTTQTYDIYPANTQ